MIDKTFYSIFQQGSRTYFYSSMFFPSYLKKDVFSLYGFVRKADNYVDSIPQNVNGFYEFKNKYYQAINGKKTNDIVIDSFANLMKRKKIEPKWVDSFLHSMEMDITKNNYKTMKETIEYIHGSAEVIGYMMARIMDLPNYTLNHAKYLGRAMQYINFIRDIAEDINLGRIYFPSNDLEKYGLIKLDYDYTIKHKDEFTNFIHNQLRRYCKWQNFAEQGYRHIPKRILIPVKTASEMYKWTAQKIYENPFILYQIKVKPMIVKIFTTTLSNIVDPKKHKYEIDKCLNVKPILRYEAYK